MIRRLPLVLAVAAAGCATSDAAEPEETGPATPPPTLGGVGDLPDTIPAEREPLVVVTRPAVDDDGNPVEAVGEVVPGSRLLMIGDSILAGTASRYGGDMCAALVPLGWQVEVDAEPGRSIEFGNEVLDDRLDPLAGTDDDWDVAAVHLGTNYREDRAEYEAELTEILERLEPRPTLLYTVTEYRPAWAEVNDVIQEVAGRFDHVTIVDWEDVARTPGVLSADGLHPTDAGEQVLVEITASALGPAPARVGDCLPTSFTDDSLVGRSQIPATPNAASTGGSSSPGSSTGSGGSTGGSSSSGSSGSGGSTGGSSGSSGSGGGSGGGVVTDPPPAVTDPPPVVTDPPPAVTDPPPVVTDPPPAVTDPPPVVTDPPQPASPAGAAGP